MKNILNPKKVDEFRKLIEKSSRIVITCHMRPDGDAIGSSLGLCGVLRALGKEASVVVPDRAPRSLSFLPGIKEIAVYTQHDPYCARLISDADLIILCDFNSHYRQGELAPLVENADCKRILIDHHQEPDVKCDLSFSFPEMSSTCELVFRIIAACGWYQFVDYASSMALLTGLITDTQNFTVNCNDPEIYEIMMRLLEKGADKNRIVDEAIKASSLSALKLSSFAILERLEVLREHRCAVITLSKKDLDDFDYEKGDTEGLVNVPLRIRGIVSSIFLCEDPDCIKVSCRSKFDYPVSQICKALFNGGGHLMAAGGEFKGTLEECHQILLEHIGDYDRYLPQKLDKLEIK